MKKNKLRFYKVFSFTLLCLFFQFNHISADGVPRLKDTVKCTKNLADTEDKTINSLRNKMQMHLIEYNNARFKMADVLNAMVSDYSLQGYSKKRILGHAKYFRDMSKKVPNLDPDTADYKNFDFQIGMGFASTVIFLNSTDDVFEHFKADQQNPESNISKFVKNMSEKEVVFKTLLEELRSKDAANCV